MPRVVPIIVRYPVPAIMDPVAIPGNRGYGELAHYAKLPHIYLGDLELRHQDAESRKC